MRFKITLNSLGGEAILPINYQYPLSGAIYRIIAQGDSAYATFLHETGYGKGFKFFTFSQINCPFKVSGDRLRLLSDELSFEVAFHLPLAMESFVKGLFKSKNIVIADRKTKVTFFVKSIESLPNPLLSLNEYEIVHRRLRLGSPVVAGLRNERENYDFLAPGDERFAASLIYNWRNKIAECFDEATAAGAILMVNEVPVQQAFKSRLITIKADTPQETKIRGWMNFDLMVTAEARFLNLIMNVGLGLYNSQGFGYVLVE